MFRSQVLRYSLRIFGFVVAVLLKSNGERMNRPAANALHHSYNRAGVDAPGEKCPERNVGLHARLHGLSKTGGEGLDRSIERAAERLLDSTLCHLPHRPIRLRRNVARVPFDLDERRRW